MKYIWDDRKNKANIRKHGIPFARAIRMFEGRVMETLDGEVEHGESRIKAVGLVDGVEIFVVYTDREGETRRIVSARKATRKERETYWQSVARSDG